MPYCHCGDATIEISPFNFNGIGVNDYSRRLVPPYTIDLNLNHVNHRDRVRVKMREWLRVLVPVPGTWYATITHSSHTNKQGNVGTGTSR